MPKTEIDYSNTIFYKISCKDETNNELYIGHTTNFVQRKSAHKASCNNPKSGSYPVKLYKTIRECGGWDNWNMEIIAFRNCNDSREARKVEQEYYDSLGATLNSIQPLPPPKQKPIRACSGKFIRDCSGKFICKECNYYTNRQSQYERHLHTSKHIQITSNRDIVQPGYICQCGKKYKYRQGLFAHRQTCVSEIEKIPTNTRCEPTHDEYFKLLSKFEMLSDTLLELLQENRDSKQIIIEQNKQIMEMMKKN